MPPRCRLSAIGSKDYLFPHEWPAYAWIFNLLPAAVVLGASRLGASIFGYAEARRLYGVRYPWAFAAKVTVVSLVMVACLGIVRAVWPTSLLEAVVCTSLGVAIVAVGLKLFRVLGAGELELLARTSIPGKHLLVRWLGADQSR